MTEADLSPPQRTLWLKGVTALQIRNFDYAIALFLDVLKQAPAFLEARKMLRRAESGKTKGQEKWPAVGSTLLVGLKMLGATKKKAPWEAIADLEERVFKTHPYDVAANEQLHDLATRVGDHELAAFALETIREGHPDNTRNMHVLAAHYMTHDQPEKAADVYHAILKRDPADLAAVQGEKQAMAVISMRHAGERRDVQKAQEMEEGDREGMTPEQMRARLSRLLGELRADPDSLALIKRLAQLYCLMDQPENAVPYFDRALQLSPGDVALAARAEQVCNVVAERKIKAMQAAIEADPAAPDIEERRARLQEIKQQRFETVLAQARERVERNPTDKQYRFDLAVVLCQCEQYRKAIPELQQARSNPHLRNRVLLLLGKCYMALKMTDLAVTAFSEAVQEIAAFTDEKKELLYELALAYEKMGRKEDYLRCLKDIYHSDYNYRDVAGRVESSYE